MTALRHAELWLSQVALFHVSFDSEINLNHRSPRRLCVVDAARPARPAARHTVQGYICHTIMPPTKLASNLKT